MIYTSTPVAIIDTWHGMAAEIEDRLHISSGRAGETYFILMSAEMSFRRPAVNQQFPASK